MESNATVNDINKQLLIYGTNKYGEPNFRVVFSEDQTERRKGTFNDFYNSIFVRKTTEIREVKKYPWIKRKWILERWADGEKAYHKDLQTLKDGVYICVWVFQDKNQNYLPPLWKVCEIVIKHLLHPRSLGEAVAQDKLSEEKKEEEEITAIEMELKIGSDEAATKDPKSSRETASVGYTKGENNE